ncbi:MAG: hypothetical protein ABMA26_11390, partial [Limisphaerales bacterium]
VHGAGVTAAVCHSDKETKLAPVLCLAINALLNMYVLYGWTSNLGQHCTAIPSAGWYSDVTLSGPGTKGVATYADGSGSMHLVYTIEDE